MTVEEETALRDETGEPEFKTFKPKEGLSGWEHKSNEEKAKEVEAEFEEEFVDVEIEEEKKMGEEKKEEVKEEKEVKEETAEQKKERYIDILVGIGFQRSKKNQNQFIHIDDKTLIGKTFDEKNPVGSQFWGFVDKNKIMNGDMKEQPIVKTFYAIRDGTEEMPDRPKEIARREEEREQEERVTAMMIKPNAIVQDAQKKADELYAVVEKQHLYQPIKGKKYLQLEAWQVLGKFCSVTGEIEWVKPVEMWDARGFEARAVIKTVELTRNEQGGITTKVGDTIAVAESMCMNDEENWQGKPMFQLKSMSQTRALSKAYRSCLSFIVALAGYAATPAEEM